MNRVLECMSVQNLPEEGAPTQRGKDRGPHPTVSVIVPSYNKPEYLPECLRSIQEQTFTEWECIVVDDGSPRGGRSGRRWRRWRMRGSGW